MDGQTGRKVGWCLFAEYSEVGNDQRNQEGQDGRVARVEKDGREVNQEQAVELGVSGHVW